MTGIPPAHASMVAREQMTSSGHGVTDRIVLSVDPATPSAEVAAFYHKVRGPGRYRTLSDKHARLAAFIAEQPLGRSWNERMAAWNRRHPAWAYGHRSNLARDAALAVRRLLRSSRDAA